MTEDSTAGLHRAWESVRSDAKIHVVCLLIGVVLYPFLGAMSFIPVVSSIVNSATLGVDNAE